MAVNKTAVEELHSLMKAVSELIKDSQQSGASTRLSTYIDLCMLQDDTLDVAKPLTVVVHCKARVEETGPTKTTSKRMLASLREVITSTPKILRDAILKRFFDKRYNEEVPALPKPGYVFEMAACMNPYFHKLKWFMKLCSSEEEAERVKDHITKKVVDLMVSIAEGVGTDPEEQPDVGDRAPSNKRKRPSVPLAGSNKKDDALTKRIADSGLFGDSSDDDPDAGPTKLSVRDVCQ